RSRRALEAEQLDASAVRPLHRHEGLSPATRALLADGGPLLARVEVQYEPRQRVLEGRAVEHGQHEPEEGHALLGVETPIDRVDQDQREGGAEVARAGFFGEDREFLPAFDKSGQLAEDDRLGGPVELDRRVAAGAYAERHATGLGAGQRQHRLAHALTDAGENLEPLAAVQGPPRTHGPASE